MIRGHAITCLSNKIRKISKFDMENSGPSPVYMCRIDCDMSYIEMLFIS